MTRIILTFVAAFLMTVATAANGLEWKTRPANSFKAPGEGRKAVNGLPDGRVATATTGDISKAWYNLPTRRYRHGILGDDVEAGGMLVVQRNGKSVSLTLPKDKVFEDRTPRLFDLDGDGKNEIIGILTSLSKGASIAIYGVDGNRIKMLAKTPYIGRSNRWRNIAGIADYNGDGAVEIAEVVTPHIGGTLKFWTWKNKRLVPAGSMTGFSNHAIGSREQRLSTTADFNADGIPDIAVPGRNRQHLRLIGFVGKARGKRKLREIAQIHLPANISRPILSSSTSGRTTITVGLTNGSTWSIQSR